jgi:glyoxylase-like metal-dependent hydrolase (beta-lactamase superfamily II)/8-oxo-dGTP pyrophosphatase MutT (NUDIX family)
VGFAVEGDRTISSTPITEAASVLLSRGPGRPELYVVRRADTLRFFGGYHAFPGGKVAAADGDLAVEVRRVAAARELFEETGVLLARRADGSFPVATAELERLRTDLLEERRSFHSLLVEHRLRLHEEDFTPLGRLVTPPFTAIRFDTAFFLARLPQGQEASIRPGELAEGAWTSPAALLVRWSRGECLISPPTVTLLQMARNHPLGELPGRLAPLIASWDAGALPPILVAPDVQLLPLATAALPPSTHTNAYLVGRDPAYLIDPGSDKVEEQQRLFDVLDAQRALGTRLAAIVLTHHHRDHVGAAAVCAGRYNAPIWAHPITAEKLRDRFAVARELREGDCLDLGVAPDGTPWFLQTHHTPGHTESHLAFYEPHFRLLFAGDMISTQSSILIVPPDGDLAIYLASLRRIRAVNCRLLLPSHGSPSAQPGRTIDECLAHRAKREEQLLESLAAGPRRVSELTEELYRSTPTAMTRLAEFQLRAGLHKLHAEGKARSHGDGEDAVWSLNDGS